MAQLTRYQKKGGFLQLLALIEGSGKSKQENFLNLIGQENKAWEKTLREKSLSIEKIFSWPQEALAEVFAVSQPMTVCILLLGFEQSRRDKIFAMLSPSDKRKYQSIMEEMKPSTAETNTAAMKLISEVRKMLTEKSLQIEKYDAALLIEDNIEEKIDADTGVFEVQALKEELTPEKSNAPAEKSGHGNKVDEQEFSALRRRFQIVASENAQLKSEVQGLKSKLEQIKRIA